VACSIAGGSYYYFSGAGDNKQTYLIYSSCLVELFPKQHRKISWEKIRPKPSMPGLKMFRFSSGMGKDLAFDGSLPQHEELAALIGRRAGTNAKTVMEIRYSVGSPSTAAANGGAPKAAGSGAAKAPDEKAANVSMQSAIIGNATRMQAMGELMDALTAAAPEHYAMLHLRAEVRKAEGRTSILFTHGTPVLLGEYSTLVPESIANAAFAVIDPLLREDDSFPGFEVVLRKTAAKQWNLDFHRLDEAGPQWSDLPRYPFRICGYGFSLAPAPNTIFRWKRTASPPGIIASTAEEIDSKSPAKAVQVMFTDAGPKLVLGQGVAKAEEVIQVSEGPDSKRWTIETPIYHSVWPDGFEFRYPLDKKTRFDLVGPDSAFIFVQGPVAIETQLLDTMAEPGQTVIGRGKTSAGHEWLEIDYEARGSKWRKRHYARNISAKMCFVVTAQCLESHAEKFVRTADEVTDSLEGPENWTKKG
jgi:hypothetical protein